MKPRISFLILTAVAMGLSAAPNAVAGDSRTVKPGEHSSAPAQRRDQDEARKAYLEGKIKPLTTILAIVEKRVKGPVIDVKLESQGKRFVYVVQVLSKDGRKVDVELDARTGEILKSRLR